MLCSALLAQLPHASDVFRMIVAGNGWPAILHGFTYAVALELAVLLFVVQHRNVESYIFAAVSILVNLSYYYLHGVALLSVAALPAWLVSIALPAAIAPLDAAGGATQADKKSARIATKDNSQWKRFTVILLPSYNSWKKRLKRAAERSAVVRIRHFSGTI